VGPDALLVLGVLVAVGFVAVCPWKFICGGVNFPIELSALVTPRTAACKVDWNGLATFMAGASTDPKPPLGEPKPPLGEPAPSLCAPGLVDSVSANAIAPPALLMKRQAESTQIPAARRARVGIMIPSHQQGASSVGYRRPLSHSMAVSYQELTINFPRWVLPANQCDKSGDEAASWGLVRVSADWSIAGQPAANQSPNWSSITPSQI
jgi:hypothetical protein